MMGYVVLAEEHLEGLQDEKLAKYLDRIGRSGQRARDLIQQMLTFSRGQRGEPRPVRLTPLIADWVNLIQSTLPSSIEIITELDPGIPAAMLDPVHIEQVLMNLCINARDAMEGQGTLTIRVQQAVCADGVCESCRQPVQGTYIELAVSDTGSGITSQVRERMFEPFYSTKAVGHGSGMGLAMVHGIVHEYGGHLLIDSRPGNGAQLRVLLPALDEEPVVGGDVQKLTRNAASLLRGRVLLVDDEPAVSEFMQDLLENWGLSVSVYNNSVEACQQFAEDPDGFDLAILDQTMPKLTGLEVARHLLKLRPDLQVVIYTGYAQEVSEEAVRRLGVQALIRKPVDTEKLHDLAERLLSANPNRQD
jgi:CheY-like chemotaxis protein